MEKICKKRNSFSITSEEETVVSKGKVISSTGLLGRLLTDEAFNKRAFKSAMAHAWNGSSRLEIKEVKDNLVDVSKLLQQVVQAQLGKGGRMVWLDMKYEKLPDFCWKRCTVEDAPMEPPNSGFGYGPKLRGTAPNSCQYVQKLPSENGGKSRRTSEITSNDLPAVGTASHAADHNENLIVERSGVG